MFCNRYAWLLSTGYASEKVNSEMCIKYLLNCFAIDMHTIMFGYASEIGEYAWLLSTLAIDMHQNKRE